MSFSFYIDCPFRSPRGREMQRRLDERIKEMESDAKDRAKEKEELEELRVKIFSSQNKNPDEEYRKVSCFFLPFFLFWDYNSSCIGMVIIYT